LYNKQLKKAVSEQPGGGVGMYPPMLAQVLKSKTVIDFNNIVTIQRKYNGVRTIGTIIDGNVLLYSRKMNKYPGLDYIKGEVQKILGANRRGIYLDGEIYKHGVALQDIAGASRREDIVMFYDYMVYDCFVPSEPNLTYVEREDILRKLFQEAKWEETAYIKQVESIRVKSMDEIDQNFKKFIEEGFEGAMIRLNLPYKYSYGDYHSDRLLKIKPVFDHEYPIIGWDVGMKGKASGAVMIICAANGKEFSVTPAMELPDRIALAKKFAEVEKNGKTHFENFWKGREIVIYFDEKSNDDIPLRGRTKLQGRIDEVPGEEIVGGEVLAETDEFNMEEVV
jgi:ATP-dependent DNA ligase